MWLYILLAALIAFGFRLAYCLLVGADLRPIIARRSCLTTAAVLGSGGHTAELLVLLRHLSQDRYQPLHFFIANTDTHSVARAVDFNFAQLHSIPRARQVGQSFSQSIITTLYAFLHVLKVVYNINPQIVICNGPGTCLPVCLAAFLLRAILFRPCKLVFIESFCRVHSLSLSGRLMRPIIDEFYVQWPALHERFPHTKYIGPLC